VVVAEVAEVGHTVQALHRGYLVEVAVQGVALVVQVTEQVQLIPVVLVEQ
tara:strand:+ start:111 stop:260 length:150 start_codon:yes stop_codon:yes gene_type:complete